MNNYICIGKIINTFGIKGELKISSDFEFKDRIFIKENKLFIGENKIEEKISSARIHKNNFLILLDSYNNINEVLKYKGLKVYIKKEDLKLNENEFLFNDLIGCEVYDDDKLLGVVIDYELTKNNVLIKVKGEKNFYIPIYSEYIEKVLVNNKKIITKNGGELML